MPACEQVSCFAGEFEQWADAAAAVSSGQLAPGRSPCCVITQEQTPAGAWCLNTATVATTAHTA
jgi:hypothetical protein